MNSAIIVIAYLVITLLIGFVLTKKSRTIQSFFVAKQQLGVFSIIVLMFSELISGSSTLGNAALAYQSGISSVWANWGMCLGALLFAFAMCKFYRKLGKYENILSIPDAYGWYFSKRCRTVLTLTVIVVYFILFSLLPKAATAILSPMLGVDPTLMTWIVCGFFIIITLGGGLKAIANMNILHAFVMYLGLFIVAILSLNHVGGFSAISALPEHFTNFGHPSLGVVGGRALGMILSLTCAPLIVHDVLGARSYKQAKRGVIIGALVIVPFSFAPAVIGLCAKLALPDISNANSALYAMANELGTVWGAVASMAVLAAILSTAPGNLLVLANSLTWDVYVPFIRKESSEKERLLFSRVCIVVCGALATLFGMTNPELLSQLMGALQIKSVAGAVLLIALLWKRVNEPAAFWAMVLGGILAAVWFFMGNPFGIEPLWPSCLLGLGVMVVISLCSKEKESACYLKYKALENLEP